MNPIFAFHALRELSKNKRAQCQVGWLGFDLSSAEGPLCTGAVIVIWSFPVFRYLT